MLYVQFFMLLPSQQGSRFQLKQQAVSHQFESGPENQVIVVAEQWHTYNTVFNSQWSEQTLFGKKKKMKQTTAWTGLTQFSTCKITHKVQELVCGWRNS